MKLTGRRFVPVNVPGFGPLRARSLNEGERAILEENAGKRIMKRIILILSLCELDTDEPVFKFDDELQLAALVEELKGIDGAVVDLVCTEAYKLNKISEADVRTLLGEPAAS